MKENLSCMRENFISQFQNIVAGWKQEKISVECEIIIILYYNTTVLIM